MFIEAADLGQVIYGYQVDQITEGDDNIISQALAAAVQEARSYFAPNLNKKDSYDGRPLYDVDAIFNTTGTDRNAIIIQHTVTLAKFHLCDLCNADIIYEQAKERYDRAINWLSDVAEGNVILDQLPTISLEEDEDIMPFSSGSRLKFNHE